MVQRAVLAIVATFAVRSPGVQSLVLTLLCVVITTVQLAARPMRDGTAQWLQGCLHACLVVVSVASTPFAEANESAMVLMCCHDSHGL